MDRLLKRLAQLDPPLQHRLERRSDGLLVTLIEPERNAQASRLIKAADLQSPERVNLVLLHAINELRRKGAQVPLDKDTALISVIGTEGRGLPV